MVKNILRKKIYIPIWLDLLLPTSYSGLRLRKYLHSNMVRFIIYFHTFKIFLIIFIYIPIWLDLLYAVQRAVADNQAAFTFQYG